MLKKLTALMLSCGLLAAMFALPITSPAKAAVVTGTALKSDIVCEVNGIRLPCLIINQHTAIVAEDLRQGGLEVVWQPDSRQLLVLPGYGRPTHPTLGTSSFGNKNRKILKTDIKTYLQDYQEITSFNLDGITAIYLKDLQTYGQVSWDETKRLASFTSSYIPTSQPVPTPQPTINNGSAKAMSSDIVFGLKNEIRTEVAFKTTTLETENQQVGFIQNGKGYVKVDWLADKLGYLVQKKDNSYLIGKDSYSFKVTPGLNNVTLNYNGKLFKETEVLDTPIVKNGSLYLSASVSENLFGLSASWNDQTRIWSISYREYDVKDNGKYSNQGKQYVVTFGFAPAKKGDDILFPHLENETLLKNPNASIDSYHYGGGDGEQTAHYCSLLPFQKNDLRIYVTAKERIVYLKHITVTSSPLEQILETKKQIGPFTEYTLTTPVKGYNRSAKPEFAIAGNITATENNIVKAVISQVQSDGSLKEIPAQTFKIDTKNNFSGQIKLPKAGLYRIHFEVTTTGLHGIKGISTFAEFYVEYQP